MGSEREREERFLVLEDHPNKRRCFAWKRHLRGTRTAEASRGRSAGYSPVNIVIVGAGFAGLEVAKGLGKEPQRWT